MSVVRVTTALCIRVRILQTSA